MSPQNNPPSMRNDLTSRRRVLAAIGTTTGTALAGCSGLNAPSDTGGEGDTIEVLVENATEERIQAAVRIEDREEDVLFSRVYELDPGHLDQSGSVESRPATITAFTPDGTTASWEYAPDLDIECEGEDIVVRLTPDGIESAYAC